MDPRGWETDSLPDGGVAELHCQAEPKPALGQESFGSTATGPSGDGRIPVQ